MSRCKRFTGTSRDRTSTSRVCRAAPSIPTPRRREPTQLFADYNRDHDMTPELDARFAALAAERVHAAPLRYYVWLPALRIADMWLRPRTELFPSDPRWWEFNDDRRWLAVSLGFGLINLRLRRSGGRRTGARARIFWHRTIRFISGAAFRYSSGALRIPSLVTRWNAIPQSSFWPRRSSTRVHKLPNLEAASVTPVFKRFRWP